MPSVSRGVGQQPLRQSGWGAAVALACVVLAVLVAVAVVLFREPISPAAALAEELAGERWYAMTFRDRPVGHYRATNRRTAARDYEFATTLRFKLGSDQETRMEDRLVFARRPPHGLIRAEHRAPGADVVIMPRTAQVTARGETRASEVDVELTLAEYLALELRLRERSAPGEVHSSRSVDFDLLAVVTHHWEVLDAEGGIEVAKAGGAATTTVLLDADLSPRRMRVGELFALHRVEDERTARLWEAAPPVFDAAGSAANRIPVDRPIGDPGRLRRLVVALDLKDAALSSRELSADRDAQPPVAAEERARAMRATVRFPARAPRMRKLAERAVGDLEELGRRADALAIFVHHHLRYRDAPPGRTVWDTLADRAGDCTEFADLFATLARAIGLPARTVVGLAYRGDAFALHAWNEVAVDGVWRGVDPTWGQTRVDAAHLPLPSGMELAVIAQLPNLRLRVVEAEYDEA